MVLKRQWLFFRRQELRSYRELRRYPKPCPSLHIGGTGICLNSLTPSISLTPLEKVFPSDVGKRGGDCLDGLKAAGLRRKGKTEIVTCLCRACYDRREMRAISYVETRRLRCKRETFTA